MPSVSPPPAEQNPRHSGRARQLTERARAALESAATRLVGKRRRRRGSNSSTGSNSSDSNASTRSDNERSNSESESVSAAQSATTVTAKPLTKKEAFDKRFKTSTRPNEKVLEKQMKLWKSSYYAHFKTPPNIIEEADGEVKYQFICRQHPSVIVTRVRHDDGTSNLKRHVERCEGKSSSAEANAMTVFASGCTYKAARHRAHLVIWIARRRRPFAIVADPELLEIFAELHAPCKTPSASTISRDMKDAHAVVKKVVIQRLAAVEGKIHVSADGWTAPQAIAFIGVVVQFVEAGLLTVLTLDYVKLTKSHTGIYLATKLAECIQDFGFEDKVGTFTGDNASNNDTLVEELSHLIPAFRGDKTRIRCFAHVLNLVAKAILSPFAQKFTADDQDAAALVKDMEAAAQEDAELEEMPEDDPVAPDVVASDAATISETEATANLDGRLPPLSSADASVARIALTKLKSLAFKIANSPTLSEALKDVCERVHIKPKRLKKNVSTRWNSTSELAASGLYLRPALDKLVLIAEHNRAGSARLRRFAMTDKEWDIMDELSPLLDSLLLATTEVSKSKTPLIHDIIPLIDSLTSICDKTIDDSTLHPAVRHAALRGLHLLNKYYARTDETIVYRIAMILHPEYKLQYFTDAGWAPDWIAEARRLITDEWSSHYRRVATPPTATAIDDPEPVTTDRFDRVRAHFHHHRRRDITIDPLEEYLTTPTIRLAGTMDVITYWSNAKTSGHPLALMALDFLSSPATSTDVERAFSRGGLTVSKLRHSLSDDSTKCTSVLGAWAEVPGLIPFDSLVELFDDKSSRTKKKRRVESESTEVITLE